MQGIGNVLTHIAQCCKPIPGDAIIGYITLNRGVTIHRSDCPNIARNKETHESRLTTVSWGQETNKKYPVDIAVDVTDHRSAIRDITGLFGGEQITVLSLNCFIDKNQHTRINLTIEVDSLEPLSKILNRIQQLSNVLGAKRLN